MCVVGGPYGAVQRRRQESQGERLLQPQDAGQGEERIDRRAQGIPGDYPEKQGQCYK